MNINLNSIISTTLDKGKEYLNIPTSKEIGNIDWSSISKIFATIGSTIIVILLSSLILYLFKSIGLYIMAKNENEKTAFISFIPYGWTYLLGKLVGPTKIFGIQVDSPELLLPVLLVSMCFPFGGILSSVLFLLSFYALLYKLYEKKSGSFSNVLLIISILFPFFTPFFIFALKNK